MAWDIRRFRTIARRASAAPFLALLFAAKLAATSLSLGSGSSGGIFSPSLYMGATLGGAFGAMFQPFFPAGDISVPAFAMVGMAAMVGGGTGAAMTAVTMIFEMTLDYAIVMPMIIAVAISIGMPPHAVARKHLHHQAVGAAAFHSQGAARQHVPGPPCRGSDGQGYAGPAGDHGVRRISHAARSRPAVCAISWSCGTTKSSVCCG